MAERVAVPPLAGTGYEHYLMSLPPKAMSEADHPGGLAPVVSELFRDQEARWKLIRENISHLALLHTNDVLVEDTNVVIQFNAERARRAGGARGATRGSTPDCFLDAENLPSEQRGLAYAGLFVAPNPFPILSKHLTGIYPEHVDQSIDLLLQPALKLAEGLGKNYAVFYNGPLAGASAPHHAHVQAVEHLRLPIEDSLDAMDRSMLKHEADKSTLYLPRALGRTVLAIESPNITLAEDAARAVIERLPIVEDDPYDEPRMNLLVRAMGNGAIRTLIAPRTDPTVALNNAEASVLRPASLEAIAGIVVVSNEHDYDHLDDNPNEVRHIFDRTIMGRTATRDYLHDLDLAA